MNLGNDLVFAALLSILTTIAVWLLEKLPLKFTTDQRPIVAQVLGALAGLAYSFPAVYEFLNRVPVPADATPATYVIGGWWAGLAAIGLHQSVKQTNVLKSGGVGLLVLTLILGGAGIAATGCASGGANQSLGDMIDAATITQSRARVLLIQVQDARVAVLKSVAAIYVAAPDDERVREMAYQVDAADVRFRDAWRRAAVAVDGWSPAAFVAAYNDAKYEVDTMKRWVKR